MSGRTVRKRLKGACGCADAEPRIKYAGPEAYVSDGLGRDVLRASRPNGGTVSAKPRTGPGPGTVGALKKFYKFPLIEKEGEAPGHRLYS